MTHQNYHVGYGTTPGHERTAERRSFFWFHVPEFEGEIVSAHISLKMAVSTSLIFGKGPGDPGPLVPDDEFESFQLSHLAAPPSIVTSPTITSGEAQVLFDMIDDTAIASEKVFFKSTPYTFPFVVDIHLDSLGMSILDSSRGGDMVMAGWMPSWSYDDRVVPGGAPPDWFEKHELLFGLSDVPHAVPFPTLTIATVPVPEPASIAACGVGVLAILRRRKR